MRVRSLAARRNDPNIRRSRTAKRRRTHNFQKKRPRSATVEEEAEEEGEAEEEAEAEVGKGANPVKRRLAAAPKMAWESVHEALLMKPAKVARPPQSQRPTAHAGGKIYFSKPKGAYRVHLRMGDRIEKVVKVNVACNADMRHKFNICCALIESDTRPRAT